MQPHRSVASLGSEEAVRACEILKEPKYSLNPLAAPLGSECNDLWHTGMKADSRPPLALEITNKLVDASLLEENPAPRATSLAVPPPPEIMLSEKNNEVNRRIRHALLRNVIPEAQKLLNEGKGVRREQSTLYRVFLPSPRFQSSCAKVGLPLTELTTFLTSPPSSSNYFEEGSAEAGVNEGGESVDTYAREEVSLLKKLTLIHTEQLLRRGREGRISLHETKEGHKATRRAVKQPLPPARDQMRVRAVPPSGVMEARGRRDFHEALLKGLEMSKCAEEVGLPLRTVEAYASLLRKAVAEVERLKMEAASLLLPL